MKHGIAVAVLYSFGIQNVRGKGQGDGQWYDKKIPEETKNAIESVRAVYDSLGGILPDRIGSKMDQLYKAKSDFPFQKIRIGGRCRMRAINRCCIGSDASCFTSTGDCMCDEACILHGDCCADYFQLCKPAFGKFGDRKFALSQIVGKWYEANDFCADINSDLARIDSPEVQAYITNFIFTAGYNKTDFWIGLNDIEKEKQWEWNNDGAEYTMWTNWGRREPNSQAANKEDCVMITARKDNAWTDKPCHRNKLFVCEKTAFGGIADQSMAIGSISLTGAQTFDGLDLDTRGFSSTITIAKLCNPDSAPPTLARFSVAVDFQVTGLYESEPTGMLSTPSMIQISAFGYSITMGGDIQTLINGEVEMLPWTTSDGRILVSIRGNKRCTELPYEQISVCIEHDFVDVKLTAPYWGSVCGLLGNFDGDAANDLSAPNNPEIVFSDMNQMGEFWAIDAGSNYQKSILEPRECDDEFTDQAFDFCTHLSSSPFDQCAVSTSPFINQCVAAMCEAGTLLPSIRCNTAMRYVEVCRLHGTIITEWRSEYFCAAKCPPHSTYSSCGPRCQEQCSTVENPEQRCIGDCVEGCFCDAGYLLDSETQRCVTATQCPCRDEFGLPFEVGASFLNSDCTEKCTCLGAGQKLNCNFHECTPYETCTFDEKDMSKGKCEQWSDDEWLAEYENIDDHDYNDQSYTDYGNYDNHDLACLNKDDSHRMRAPDGGYDLNELKDPSKAIGGAPSYVKPNACCGDTPFNNETKECCGGKAIYDPLESFCCSDNKVKVVIGGVQPGILYC